MTNNLKIYSNAKFIECITHWIGLSVVIIVCVIVTIVK